MTPAPGQVFTAPIDVRFKHCDPAGIAFYPRLFEFANDMVEAWFEALGVGFPELIGQRALGAPTVKIAAEFRKPCRYGETLDGRLHPVALGQRSVDLRIELAGPEGETRAAFDVTLVCVERDAVKSRAWPDDLRESMRAWLAAPETR